MMQAPVPIRPSRPSKYRLTEADKEYLRSLAVDGVIPIEAHISAMFKILNTPRAEAMQK